MLHTHVHPIIQSHMSSTFIFNEQPPYDFTSLKLHEQLDPDLRLSRTPQQMTQ